jgi:ankyrin repeat protein
MVKLLLKFGADPNGLDWQGWAPLHAAAWNDEFQAIRILVRHGAVVDYQHKEIGITPLMEAASKGNCESIVTLIELGADPHLQSTDGLTALDIAKRDQWAAARMILEMLTQK